MAVLNVIYETKRYSHNADFILIVGDDTTTFSPVGLSLPRAKYTQPFYTTCCASRAPFFNLRRSRHHHPLNLLNLLNHHTEGVSKQLNLCILKRGMIYV